MKKQALQKAFLVLLPILAVALATTMDSVTVFNQQTGETVYGSYFSLLGESGLYMIAPLAALVGAVTGILAVICLITKKTSLLNLIRMAGFASTTLAVVPILLRGETMIVPNVGFPILMIAESGLAWVMGHTPNEAETPKNPKRLSKR